MRKLDAGKGEKLPSLEEVLNLLINKEIILFIEIKATNCKTEVAKIIEDNNYYTKCLVKSFNHRIIKKIKEIDPQIKTQALLYGLPIDPVVIVKSANSDGLSISTSTIDKTLVEQCHKASLEVTTWNANSIEEMQKLKKMGVDYIGTDYPGLFKE